MAHHAEHSHCRELLKLLSDYIDGELEALLCQEIEAHLASCENCRIVVDTLRKTVMLYRTVEEEPSLPAEVEERLFKVLDLEPYLQDLRQELDGAGASDPAGQGRRPTATDEG